MTNQLIKLLRIIRYPHICYLLFLRDRTSEIERQSQDYDLWSVLVQFYRSNRRRGFSRKESIERALDGYGCYKGWEIGNKWVFL